MIQPSDSSCNFRSQTEELSPRWRHILKKLLSVFGKYFCHVYLGTELNVDVLSHSCQGTRSFKHCPQSNSNTHSLRDQCIISTMSSDKPVLFYDIASGPPLRTFSPNPWKTRYALNFKGVHYQTKWVDLPNIASVREGLGVPANRTLPDGSPYHTLPIIQDPSTGQIIGDTFEIALYLDKTYPAAPALFRQCTTGLTAAFNAQVDGLFTKFVALCDQMPFDKRIADKVKDIFAKRFGLAGGKDLQMSDEDRERTLVQFENALGEFIKAYQHVGGTTDHFWSASGTAKEQAQTPGRNEIGFWLDGEQPVYADLIVGAWLAMMEASMKPGDWQRLRSWQGGFWGKLHDQLKYLREIK